MSKKKIKKQKNKSPEFGLNFQVRTGKIGSNLMLVMLALILIVFGVMFAYCRNIIKTIYSDSFLLFIKSSSVFAADNFKKITSQGEANSASVIRSALNNNMPAEYQISDIYIYGKNTGDPEDDFNSTTFKGTPDGSFDGGYWKFDKNAQTPEDRLAVLTKKGNKYKVLYFQHPKLKNFYIYLISKESQGGMGQIAADNMNNASAIFFGITVLLSCIAVYMFSRSITAPLSIMEKTISKIADGDLSGRLEYTRYYEINLLVQSYNMMANTLQSLYSSLESQVRDRTKELKNAYTELQNTQAMMVHSEKMKSLGELVAGIMHEINNPINFIYGNMTHLSNYSNDLIRIIEEYTKYNSSLKPEEKTDIENLKTDIDYEFLKSDLPDLIKSCKEGADRAKNIIQDLKSFSRMEEAAITDVDIPHEIDMTLNILHNKLKNKAEIHKEYMNNVPKIEAFGGQLNQVFMNILDNAAGAIAEHGDIWIRINKDKTDKNLIIEIEDNGSGMDEETARKVFDPFFTTKPVGKGTGLGMSITHKIIKNHQGSIRVESVLNQGSKFIITLPLNIDRENINASLVSGETNG